MRKWIAVLALLAVTNHYVPTSSPLSLDKKELTCLMDNVYYEARGEPFYGQALVARVTLNRAKKMNKSICATVYQPYQFSWTLGSKRKSTKSLQAYHAAFAAFSLPQTNLYFYHAKTVSPYWASPKPALVYGNHVFYTETVQ